MHVMGGRRAGARSQCMAGVIIDHTGFQGHKNPIHKVIKKSLMKFGGGARKLTGP